MLLPVGALVLAELSLTAIIAVLTINIVTCYKTTISRFILLSQLVNSVHSILVKIIVSKECYE